MAFFDEVGKKISRAGQSAVQKTKDFTEITRINGLMSDEEKVLESLHVQIGKLYISQHGQEREESFAQLLDAADAVEKKLEDYRQQIRDLKGILLCANCGAEMQADAAFCIACGAPAPRKPKPVCSSCGQVMEEGMRFCTRCGLPLGEAAPAPAYQPPQNNWNYAPQGNNNWGYAAQPNYGWAPAPQSAPANLWEPAAQSAPTAEPVVEAVPEPVAEPVVEAVPEPVAEPVVEAVPEPVAEPVVEAVPEPVAEPVVEAVPEPVAEAVVEAAPEPVAEAVAEIRSEAEEMPAEEPLSEEDEDDEFGATQLLTARRCPDCGAENAEGMSFCTACGCPL